MPRRLRQTLSRHAGWLATALAVILAIAITAGSEPLITFWSWRGAAVALLSLASVALLLWHSRDEPGGLPDSRDAAPSWRAASGGAYAMSGSPEDMHGTNSDTGDRVLQAHTTLMLLRRREQHPAPEHSRTPLRQALIPAAVALALLVWNLIA